VRRTRKSRKFSEIDAKNYLLPWTIDVQPSLRQWGMNKMKPSRTRKSNRSWPVPDEVIASFGSVRLIRNADGRPELIGGTAYDQITVRKWCRRFAPFVQFVGHRAPNCGTYSPFLLAVPGCGPNRSNYFKGVGRTFRRNARFEPISLGFRNEPHFELAPTKI